MIYHTIVVLSSHRISTDKRLLPVGIDMFMYDNVSPGFVA